ncbi:MAG: hypothetical protein M1835_001818 [Candelina submexicana]|nr:MAG: hypothetical protein M1835_001818 [Candelina submexicana]
MATASIIQILQKELKLRSSKAKDRGIIKSKAFRKNAECPSNQKTPVIPNPRIFTDLLLPDDSQQTAALAVDDDSFFSYPAVGQCATHLALLECFSRLKRRVMRSEVLDTKFGILAEHEKEHREIYAGGYDDLEGICAGEGPTAHLERKWELFVEMAVDRFETWWTGLDFKATQREQSNSENSSKGGSDYHSPSWASDLPPLDILMVWHAYMLNPHCYYEDCLRHNKLSLYDRGLPWHKLNDAIDKERWIYNPPKSLLQSKVPNAKPGHDSYSLTPFLLETLESCPEKQPLKFLQCPMCGTGEVPQTIQISLVAYFSADHSVVCPHCAGSVDREQLKVYKMKTDYVYHLHNERRMPGTILHVSGNFVGQEVAPNDPAPKYLANLLEIAFPNTESILEHQSVASVEDHLREVARKMPVLHEKESLPLRKQMKLIDTLLSRYRGNSSIFALNLKDAVIRQGSFVDKMNNILWIRSPNLEGTITRARERYRQFFRLIARYPRQVFVPTLDVDIIWHTQQLCPREYLKYSTRVCKGRYIDHDDKIPQQGTGGLDEGFEETKRVWKEDYPEAEDYALCLCWHCERKKDYRGTDSTLSAKELERRIAKEVECYRGVERARREHTAVARHI